MRRKINPIVVAFLMFTLSGSARVTRAAITYFDNGQMPDFPQVWDPGQKKKGICAAATTADIMWYWDAHGYPGLIDHKANATGWRDDAEPLVYQMSKYLYGRDPVTDKIAIEGQGSILAGLNAYINKRAQTTPFVRTLVVDKYEERWATYASWTATIGAGNTNFGGFEWKDANDKRIAEHSMTGAGVDGAGERLIVTHGWDDHPGNVPPFKAPPYAANEKPYINSYLMSQGATGRMAIIPADQNQVADAETAELFQGNTYGKATRMTLTEFYSIHPTAKARAEIKKKKAGGIAPPDGKTRAAVASFDSTYDVKVSNDSFTPIYQFIQQVETPIDASTAPAGWQAVPWSSLYTGDITGAPPLSSPPPDEEETVPDDEPALHGVLWYTNTLPIFPGQQLEGFSFNTSDSFDAMAEDSLSVVSDGVSSYIDASSDGQISEAFSATLVPEPAGAMGVLLIAAAAAARRNRRASFARRNRGGNLHASG